MFMYYDKLSRNIFFLISQNEIDEKLLKQEMKVSRTIVLIIFTIL
jgi:hypothetical protein